LRQWFFDIVGIVQSQYFFISCYVLSKCDFRNRWNQLPKY
jgi:uncharacterized membrane protein YhaH (DUF805 family)